MNFDNIESIEFIIKILRRNNDIILNEFVNLAVKGNIKQYSLNNSLVDYFKLPSTKYHYNTSFFLNNEQYIFWYYLHNNQICLFDYFKESTEITNLNYYIKNIPNFVKLLIICKKNKWIINSINDGIIKVDKSILLDSYFYCNIELFKMLTQMENIDNDLVSIIRNDGFTNRSDMFKEMIKYINL